MQVLREEVNPNIIHIPGLRPLKFPDQVEKIMVPRWDKSPTGEMVKGGKEVTVANIWDATVLGVRAYVDRTDRPRRELRLGYDYYYDKVLRRGFSYNYRAYILNEKAVRVFDEMGIRQGDKVNLRVYATDDNPERIYRGGRLLPGLPRIGPDGKPTGEDAQPFIAGTVVNVEDRPWISKWGDVERFPKGETTYSVGGEVPTGTDFSIGDRDQAIESMVQE